MSKLKTSSLLSVAIFFLSFSNVSAQVVINEVLPNPTGDDTGNEWVELYNSGANSVDLAGYKLKDAADHEQIISSNSIAPGAWLTIHSQGSFSLNNSGIETINLYYVSSADPISTFSYTGSTEGKSWGRIPDGGSIYAGVLDPTEGTANQIPPTPTPSPSPTPKPTPTKSPTPTPIKSPTPTPTKTPTPNAKSTSKPTTSPSVGVEQASQGSGETSVLGLRNELTSPSPTPQVSEDKKNVPFVPILLIAAGVVFLGFAGFTIFRKANEKTI